MDESQCKFEHLWLRDIAGSVVLLADGRRGKQKMAGDNESSPTSTSVTPLP